MRMIFGCLDTAKQTRLTPGDLGADPGGTAVIKDGFGIRFRPPESSFKPETVCIDQPEKKRILFFEGRIFNTDALGLPGGLGKRAGEDRLRKLFNLHDSEGDGLLRRINGSFIIGIAEPERKRLMLARDQLGVETVYFRREGERIFFSTGLEALLPGDSTNLDIDHRALAQYLMFNYIPGRQGLVRGIRQLEPASILTAGPDGIHERAYWSPDFTPVPREEQAVMDELLDRMRKAVRIRVDNGHGKTGVFLSGGMDSSSVLGLMSEAELGSIDSYSFRCRGKSIDESYFAGVMARACRTEHHLVEYAPERVRLIEEMAGIMDNPFSDIGIEVATYLLGKSAHGRVNTILTGDGGDELFAGHPVYLADRMASRFDRIPEILRKPVRTISGAFPDSDRKASFRVKAKRFAYSVQFPATLHSNRWRAYYTDQELARLISPEFVASIRKDHPFEEIAGYYEGTGEYDPLSACLFGDYRTVVKFYLGRMRLLRHFGIESRFPLLDAELVQFAAGIPAALKINGRDVKYILKKTMAGVLPDEIVFRKDKLGHSVPFKNWLRDHEGVKTFVLDHLNGGLEIGSIRFSRRTVNRMISEHISRHHNHSHRLWALLVLKLWYNRKKRR
jgi:asparagine synthase (glutamine-hydrolysing)